MKARQTKIEETNLEGYIPSRNMIIQNDVKQNKTKSFKYKINIDYKNMLKYGIFISVVVLIGISFFFIRNYIVTGGDLLGIDSFLEACEEGAIDSLKPSLRKTPEKMGMSIFEMLLTNEYNEEAGWIENTFKSFVGVLGKMKFFLPIFIYIVYCVIFIVGISGLILKLFNSKIDKKSKVLYLNLLLCLIIPIILTIKYSYSTDYQAQGRYIYPIWLALIVFFCKGMEYIISLIKNDKIKITICIVFVLFIIYVIFQANYVFFTSIKLV